MELPRQARWLEWPTFSLFLLTYFCFAAVTHFASNIPTIIVIGFLSILLTMHSSLQHETIHILEPKWPILSFVLATPALGMAVPYCRFRDLHLVHHINEQLTDPFDDPETGYLEPSVWDGLSGPIKVILLMNNVLIGRILLGPAIGIVAFIHQDIKLIIAGDNKALFGWLKFIPAISAVFLWLYFFGTVQVWHYALACYIALSILKIRTFIEHRAHELSQGRSVIVEDRGPLSILFLNNNFHAVHHTHPNIPWYNLPATFNNQKNNFLKHNDNYYFKNYFNVFKRYLLVKKEEVAHPIWNLQNRKKL